MYSTLTSGEEEFSVLGKCATEDFVLILDNVVHVVWQKIAADEAPLTPTKAICAQCPFLEHRRN